MADFTPGPWSVSTPDASDPPYDDVYVVSSYGLVATTERSLSGGGLGDARLIAAAPDLYEALRKIADGLPGTFEHETPYEQAQRIARAALAKAKGEST